MGANDFHHRVILSAISVDVFGSLFIKKTIPQAALVKLAGNIHAYKTTCVQGYSMSLKVKIK